MWCQLSQKLNSGLTVIDMLLSFLKTFYLAEADYKVSSQTAILELVVCAREESLEDNKKQRNQDVSSDSVEDNA